MIVVDIMKDIWLIPRKSYDDEEQRTILENLFPHVQDIIQYYMVNISVTKYNKSTCLRPSQFGSIFYMLYQE